MSADGEVRVAFFGDSICAGQLVSPHRTWASELSARLERVAAGHGRRIVVANPSTNGDQTRLALERMPKDIQAFRPHLLLVQFGMNDANVWQTDDGLPRVSEAAFQANLREIVARGRNAGAQAVALHTNHPTTRDHAPLTGTSQTYQERNAAYNELIRAVAAADDGITLVDIETAWRERTGDSREALEELLLADELHLSEQGHRLYAEITGPVLERELCAILDGGR